MYLVHPSILFLTLGALLGRFVFGLRQRLLQGHHLGRGPWQIYDDPVILQSRLLLYIYISIDRVLLTFVLLELPLGKAELILGPLEVLLQYGDLRSQCGRGQQRSLHSHIDTFLLRLLCISV